MEENYERRSTNKGKDIETENFSSAGSTGEAYQEGGRSERGPPRSFRETFKSGSPDEVRDKVKDTVSKGVAAVAGALRGFTDESRKEKLPEQTKGAISQAAETTKSTVSGVTESVSGLKQPLKEAGQKIRETARDVKQTTRDEYRQTKDALRSGPSSSPTSSTSGLGSSSLGRRDTSSYERGSSVIGSPAPGESATGLGTEMPDISKTPMAKSDRELKGKDLREFEE